MLRIASKYLTIFSIALSERFTYRTDFFIGTLMRFMPIVTTIFLWKAVFAGTSDPNARIANLTADGMVAYYLLVLLGRAFSSMPGLAHGIAADVRTGNIKKYLTQPVDLIGFLLTMRIAHKLVYYSIAALPFALVFYLCRRYFPETPEPQVIAVFVMSLFMGFLIGFLFETLIGMMSFWVLEISSFSFIIITLNYLLSGHMFPLDLIPGWFGEICRALPFQYLAYFPAMVYLHGSQWLAEGKLWTRLLEPFACVVGLYVLVRLTYRRGLYRYSAFGG